MSYSNPDRRTYSFGVHDFGGGSESLSIRGPKGKAGRLRDIMVCAVETFADGTGDVQVGTSGNADAYAKFVIGTLADTNSAAGSDGTTDIDWLIDAEIPADTQVEVTFTQPAAGAQTGMATVHITIDWDD